MKRNIVIYSDEGAGEFGLSCLQKFFTGDNVALCDASAIIDGALLATADIFIMPGGADLPYCRKLNGQGNTGIRTFVEAGGTYLGICAGAYYGCRDIEYHKGRADEICGTRDLAFMDTTGYGSLPDLAPWYDNSLYTAAITTIDGRQVFYNGGCAFRVDDPFARIIARYDAIPGNPVAIVEKTVGKGRVLLSGVHFEIGKNALKEITSNTNDQALRHTLSDAFETDMTNEWKCFLGLGAKE